MRSRQKIRGTDLLKKGRAHGPAPAISLDAAYARHLIVDTYKVEQSPFRLESRCLGKEAKLYIMRRDSRSFR